jgi:hypothetical protein
VPPFSWSGHYASESVHPAGAGRARAPCGAAVLQLAACTRPRAAAAAAAALLREEGRAVLSAVGDTCALKALEVVCAVGGGYAWRGGGGGGGGEARSWLSVSLQADGAPRGGTRSGAPVYRLLLEVEAPPAPTQEAQPAVAAAAAATAAAPPPPQPPEHATPAAAGRAAPAAATPAPAGLPVSLAGVVAAAACLAIEPPGAAHGGHLPSGSGGGHGAALMCGHAPACGGMLQHQQHAALLGHSAWAPVDLRPASASPGPCSSGGGNGCTHAQAQAHAHAHASAWAHAPGAAVLLSAEHANGNGSGPGHARSSSGVASHEANGNSAGTAASSSSSSSSSAADQADPWAALRTCAACPQPVALSRAVPGLAAAVSAALSGEAGGGECGAASLRVLRPRHAGRALDAALLAARLAARCGAPPVRLLCRRAPGARGGGSGGGPREGGAAAAPLDLVLYSWPR